MVRIERARDKLADLQSKRAELTAVCGAVGQRMYEFVISNNGPGKARDIKVMLDGKPLHEHPVMANQPEKPDRMSAGSVLKYPFCPSMDNPAPDTVRIEWNDDSGEAGVYESDL